jgi:DNA-binding MarR family transcriptional regulator
MAGDKLTRSGPGSKLAAPAVSPLEAHVGYWLRFVSNHVSQALRLKVEGKGVTVAEWVALRAVYRRKACSPSALGEALGMTRAAVSRLLDRLAAKRLVQRGVTGADKRYQSITLTAAGQKLVPVLAALADANDEQFFGHLSIAERTQLIELMKQVVRVQRFKDVPVD